MPIALPPHLQPRKVSPTMGGLDGLTHGNRALFDAHLKAFAAKGLKGSMAPTDLGNGMWGRPGGGGGAGGGLGIHQQGVNQMQNMHQQGVNQMQNMHQQGVNQMQNMHWGGVNQMKRKHRQGLGNMRPAF